jgi:hypothetical protein
MTALTLVSPHERSLRPLVQAALENELRLLRAGIERTERRLKELESQYGMSSSEFLRRYGEDELEETLELIEWVGELRLLERLCEQAETVQEIRFAN